MKASQVWQAALGELQLQMSKATFETWVKPSKVLSYEDGEFIIAVPTAFIKDWLESKLLSSIKRSLSGILGRSVAVTIIVFNQESDEEPQSLLNGIQPVEINVVASASNGYQEDNDRPTQNSNLNPNYKFENFVVGPSNRLAHAACLAVAEKPAGTYNPLFLYGGVGLGKTHLLHAIGARCKSLGLESLYVSSEEFTNDLINAIRNQYTQGFRDKYRKLDMLLIDDIQFIAGKESTQEEFFHTFNTLHGTGKQIVMSSDRPPKSMVTLEERLRSRFEWGLIADIQLPDIETRNAILRSKAEALNFDVPSDVIDFIARQVQNNIRELEGALNRVIAHVQLTNSELNVETANIALQDLVARPASSLSLDEVFHVIASYYRLTIADLTGRSRSKEIVRPRQVAMYLAREELQATLPQIGEALGGRDHTTVMYGVNKISRAAEQDDGLRRDLMTIREKLYNRNGAHP